MHRRAGLEKRYEPPSHYAFSALSHAPDLLSRCACRVDLGPLWLDEEQEKARAFRQATKTRNLRGLSTPRRLPQPLLTPYSCRPCVHQYLHPGRPSSGAYYYRRVGPPHLRGRRCLRRPRHMPARPRQKCTSLFSWHDGHSNPILLWIVRRRPMKTHGHTQTQCAQKANASHRQDYEAKSARLLTPLWHARE